MIAFQYVVKGSRRVSHASYRQSETVIHGRNPEKGQLPVGDSVALAGVYGLVLTDCQAVLCIVIAYVDRPISIYRFC